MTQFEAIFFDLDNTLFDHQHSSQMGLAALQSRFAALNEHRLPALEKVYYDILNQNYHDVLSGHLSMDAARQEGMTRYLAHFGIEADEEAAATAVNMYRAAYEANQRVVPGAEEVLALLYGRFKLGIITNGLVFYQFQKLGRLHLRQYFDHVVISEAVGAQKPESAIFEIALQLFNVTAQTAVMVGDSWQSDIMGSTQVGLTAVWLNRFNETAPATSHVHEINQLPELTGVIEKPL